MSLASHPSEGEPPDHPTGRALSGAEPPPAAAAAAAGGSQDEPVARGPQAAPINEGEGETIAQNQPAAELEEPGPSSAPAGASAPTDEHDVAAKAYRCAAKIVTHLAAAVILVLLLVSIMGSILWGLDPSVLYGGCAERTCETCAADGVCKWCSGPGGANRMPGYCEDSKAGKTDATCTAVAPTAEVCNASNVLERNWQACRGGDESNVTLRQIQCEDAEHNSSCAWCGSQASCLPRQDGLCEAADAPNSIPATEQRALSPTHPACVRQTRKSESSTSGGAASMYSPRSRSLWTDRSNEPTRNQFTPLAANHTYTTGIICHWVLECSFNETVQVRFQRVHLDASSELRVFDGWNADSWSSQLAYFLDFDGDRLAVASPNSSIDLSTSISGGVSSREFYSVSPVLTVRFQSGWTSSSRQHYSEKHGNIYFAGDAEHPGFHLTHRCQPPPSYYGSIGYGMLGLWWIMVVHFLRKAHKLIFYGSKTCALFPSLTKSI
jgi:hypothetical protein